ncbi:MAG: DUF2079 domain-containing protein [Caldisphaera sp.]
MLKKRNGTTFEKAHLFQNLRENRLEVVILVLAFVSYVSVWSYITILKLYTLNQPYWDLGVFVQRGLEVVYTSWTFNSFLYKFLGGEIVFIVFPLTLLKSLSFLLIVQSFFIGVAVFPIYGISRHYLNDKRIALLVSLSYLLYFPMAGLNWFSMHYQMFFVPFFILAYFSYLKRYYKTSFVFFILSGFVRYPFILLIMLFSFVFGISVLIDNLKASSNSLTSVKENLMSSYRQHIFVNKSESSRDIIINNERLKFLFMLFVVSSIIFLVSYFYLVNYHETIVSGISSTKNSGLWKVQFDLENKFLTILFILLPYLFFVFLSKKWLVMLLPYFFIVFYFNNTNFIYPYVFMGQYSSLFAPFVVIGSIEGLSTLTDRRMPYIFRIRRNESKRKSIKLNRKIVVAGIAILSVSLISANIFEPYGPLNGQSPVDFDLKNIMRENTSAYYELQVMLNFIPENDPFIIFQNNFPEIGLRDFGNNPVLTNYVIDYNSTFFNVMKQKWQPIQKIDYILVSAYYDSGEFLAAYAPPHNLSLFWIVYNAIASGHYGVLAEASGMLLLERNYSGVVKYFVPISENIPVTSLYNASSGNLSSSIVMSWSNISDMNLWYGPYIVLVPGLYKLTFEMKSSNTSSKNHFMIADGANMPVSSFNEFEVYGTNFSVANTWTDINTTIYVNNVYGYVKLNGFQATWNGTLSLRGIEIKEVAS